MRRGRLFLGSELPRLLVLAAIALVGWPLACLYGGRPAPRPASRRPIADMPPLPPPDDSVVFAGLQDKTPLNLRDNPAVAELLERSRATPAATLAAESRRDVGLRDLIREPERYRGLPIHVEGTARQIFRNENKDPLLSRRGQLYEAWVYGVDDPRYPFCLMFEVPPEGLPGGRDIQEYVAFDGYFLKLLAYDAGDVRRFAPLLVGRLGWSPNGGATADGQAQAGWLDRPFPGLSFSRRQVMLGALAIMMVVTMLRIVLGLGRRPAPTTVRTSTTLAPSDQIEPDDLAAWLEGGAKGPDAEGGEAARD
jgi:hypothetical protein